NQALAGLPALDRACARTRPLAFRSSPSSDQTSPARLPHVPSCPCTRPYTSDSPYSPRCTRQSRLQLPESSGTSLQLPNSIHPQTSQLHSYFSPVLILTKLFRTQSFLIPFFLCELCAPTSVPSV